MKIIIFLIFSSTCFADHIVLKNLSVVQGEIIRNLNNTIVMRTGKSKRFIVHKQQVSLIIDINTLKYIRFYEKHEEYCYLETKIRSFKKGGTLINLVSVLHYGDYKYYRILQKKLDSNDIVIYEGIGSGHAKNLENWSPPSKKFKKFQMSLKFNKLPDSLVPKNSIPQLFAAKELELEFQLSCIDYKKSFWVSSDMGEKEFAFEMMKARGKQILPKIKKMRFCLNHNKENLSLGKEDKKMFARNVAKSVDHFKKGKSPTMDVLLFKRNDILFKSIKQSLRNKKLKKIGVFYGAAHMADIEERLILLGFKIFEDQWITAWDMTPILKK